MTWQFVDTSLIHCIVNGSRSICLLVQVTQCFILTVTLQPISLDLARFWCSIHVHSYISQHFKSLVSSFPLFLLEMKILFRFITCSSEAHLPRDKYDTPLVVEKPRQRKKGRAKKRISNSSQWRPSLLSISEDVLKTESRSRDIRRPGWLRSLKMKVSSIFQIDHSRSFYHDDIRRNPIPEMVMAAPFMF